MIKVESLSRNYGDFKAVDNVSFEIKKGEVVGLLGHNGAGKTTIMKMMTGYLEPTSGMIKVDQLQIDRDRAERAWTLAALCLISRFSVKLRIFENGFSLPMVKNESLRSERLRNRSINW